MPPTLNEQLIESFDLLGKYRDLEGERFKALAYYKAAQTIRGLEKPVTEYEKLEGIGSSIAEKIKDFVETGKIALLEKYSAQIPLSVFEMTQLVGIGPKKAVKLFQELGVKSLKELRSALDSGKIVDEKLKAAFIALVDERVLYSYICPLVSPILEDIRTWPGVVRVEFAGSMRRHRPTIGDVDLIVACENPSDVHAKFAKSGVSLSSGILKSSNFVEANGRQYRVDLLTTDPSFYGAALQYFTGSKEHNIALRIFAKSKGLKMNEYGIWDANEKRIDKPGLDEAEMYTALGMPCPSPLMREGSFLTKEKLSSADVR